MSVTDTRCPTDHPPTRIEDAHPSVVNNVRWHPNAQWIMTSGNDACIRVFDLRKAAGPLLQLTDHLTGRSARALFAICMLMRNCS